MHSLTIRILYHLLLQLCAGASAEERVKWRLLPAAEYHYLNQSTCYELQGVDNADEFKVQNAG